LVELLVVIGIMSLLISLLLPSLTMARRSAQRTACTAKLHSIMLAAQQHRVDHIDYYPLVGVVPGIRPEDLDDAPDTKKYDYYSMTDGSMGCSSTGARVTRALCPMCTSLETEMQGSKALNSSTGLLSVAGNSARISEMLDPRLLNANFLCPAQADSPLEINPQFVLMYYPAQTTETGLMVPQSYIFNEYVLGWQDNLGHLRGKGGMVRRPDVTMFAADGLGGAPLANHGGNGPLFYPLYTLYNQAGNQPASLADALNSTDFGNNKAGDHENFDPIRHKGKINIAFCDGHVETRNITAADLNSAWIVSP
jgi:prepilin-type processing-associated H-X9-DG protein